MSVYAAKCPCCGRDIGFEEGAEECTCIFCGAKLLTSALSKELVRSDEHEKEPEKAPEKEPEEAPETAPVPKEKAEEAEKDPELTPEEIAQELDRKVEFKAELHRVVRQIDELREKRSVYKAQIKSSGISIGVGAGLIAAAPLLMLFFYDREKGFTGGMTTWAIAAGVVGLVVLAIGIARRRDARNGQNKLEATIRDKKDKRDILIGRLNKINKKLHIHHDQ